MAWAWTGEQWVPLVGLTPAAQHSLAAAQRLGAVHLLGQPPAPEERQLVARMEQQLQPVLSQVQARQLAQASRVGGMAQQTRPAAQQQMLPSSGQVADLARAAWGYVRAWLRARRPR
jgi:hypothetical protein